MNRQTDEEQLLNEVLAESLPESRRDELLSQTLLTVRRRRHTRQARRTVVALLLVLGLGFLLWPRAPHRMVQSNAPKPYVVVQTQPLPESEIVKTAPLRASSRVTSGPTATVISTATAPHLAREIDDAGLLSLAAPNPAVLVRLGPHSAELVFAHTTDPEAAENQTEPQ